MSANLPDSVPKLVDAGVMAYKVRLYADAIKHLCVACDMEPNNWRAKLYLGMSYYYAGQLVLSAGQFRYLQNHCTDTEIRKKAESALSAMNAELKNKMPDMTCTIKKPDITALQKQYEQQHAQKAPTQDDENLEWVDNKALAQLP